MDERAKQEEHARLHTFETPTFAISGHLAVRTLEQTRVTPREEPNPELLGGGLRLELEERADHLDEPPLGERHREPGPDRRVGVLEQVSAASVGARDDDTTGIARP
jgi:hypothetical protein